MKRIGTILGIAFTVMILVSGSAQALWHYADLVEDYQDCTHPEYALYAPDDAFASLGVNDSNEGWIILDLGAWSGMPGGYEFTVFSSSTLKETYNLTLISGKGTRSSTWTEMDDTTDEVRTSPSISGDVWRYFEIHTEEGQGSTTHDPAFGSEIDAVGWETSK
jgi:hypothetical protein